MSMTDAELNEILTNGGNASRHYLIKISGNNIDSIFVCNNNENIVYKNQTYNAASFDYTPPQSDNSGSKISFSSLPNEDNIFEELENAGYSEVVRLDVYEVLLQDSDITLLNYYYTLRGTFTMNYKGEAEFTPIADDRSSMTFTPYTFDTDNNRGNA